MKMNIKLSTADKIGLGIAGFTVWTIGILPSAIVGGGGWFFRDKIRNFYMKKQIQKKARDFLLIFTNIKG